MRHLPAALCPALLSAALCSAMPLAAPAAGTAEFFGEDDRHYRACQTLSRQAPEEALESALAWRDQGGGFPARHCVALALVSLGQYAQAAERLDRLGTEMLTLRPELRAEAFGQAGNAWILAGQPAKAIQSFTAGLEVAPHQAELLIDRARAQAGLERYREAEEDLGRALSLDPERADALTFRAAARRQLGRATLALEDVETALAIDPDLPEALLERGQLRRAAGDIQGARTDWVRAAVLGEGSPTAEAASQRIEEMDLRVE